MNSLRKTKIDDTMDGDIIVRVYICNCWWI